MQIGASWALTSFTLENGEKYLMVYQSANEKFYGYLNSTQSEEFKKLPNEKRGGYIEDNKFNGFKIAGLGRTVYAQASIEYQIDQLHIYPKCRCDYYWDNQSTYTVTEGDAAFSVVAEDANIFNCQGEECIDLEAEGVKEGQGMYLFIALSKSLDPNASDYENKLSKLVEFANYITDIYTNNEKVAFYVSTTLHTMPSLNISYDIINYLKRNSILNKEDFGVAGDGETGHFKFHTYAADADIIFSIEDLRSDIIPTYNENSIDFVKSHKEDKLVKYEYDFSDLAFRQKWKKDKTVIYDGILMEERNGIAPAMSISNTYKQYVECFGTEYAAFAWARAAGPIIEEMMLPYWANRLVAQHGAVIVRELLNRLGEKAFQRYVTGAVTEIAGNLIANRVINEFFIKEGRKKLDDNWGEILLDGYIAGMKGMVGSRNVAVNMTFDCLIGFDMETVLQLFDATGKEEDKLETLTKLGIQCAIPAILGVFGEKLKEIVKERTAIATNAYLFFKDKLKFTNENNGEFLYKILGFDELFASRSLHTQGILKNILSTENGAKAIDMLIDAGYDIRKITTANYQRLADVVGMYVKHDSDKTLLKSILEETTDINRALIFLKNEVTSLENYKKAIAEIRAHKKFNRTAQEIFDEAGGAIQYCIKQNGNQIYYAKICDRGAILIQFEKAENLIISSVSNSTKNYLINKYFPEPEDEVEVSDETE